MKTNFFRNTAPVIPTGAKRSGGISRLTHDATIKAGAHVNRFLGKLGMTVLLMLCVPAAVLSAQTGNGVTVGNLVVNTGSSTTVTFDVSWKTPMPVELWSDSVWVFVDYNAGGIMKRLPLAPGATLTATSAPDVGKVIEVTGNDKGVWVIGDARINGSFSATVQLLTATANVTGACAYASGYPPEAEYVSGASAMSFTGTPLYDIVLQGAENDTIYRTSGADFDIPEGYVLVSFTDKTGAPGIIKCIPPATYTLTASATGFCKDDAEGVTFALDGTEKDKQYQLYRDNGDAGDGSVLTGNGSALTFTGTFNVAGAYTAWTVAEGLTCAIAMNGSPVVVENPLPANPDVTGDSRNCPGTVTLSASSSGAVIDWYADDVMTSTLHTGESYTTPEIRTSTTYYVQARVESTGCLSAPVAVAAEVDMDGCCDAPGDTVNFTAFNPCSASTGTFWYLTDSRESNNVQTYKVKLLQDNHYWMVQDMKFGNRCGTTYTGSDGKDQTGMVSDIGTYYGNCRSNTKSGAGYLYDWAAAINRTKAYKGGSETGCSGTATGTSGTAPGACQGICPDGWHVFTAGSAGELITLALAFADCSTANDKCWNPDSAWEGTYGGHCTKAGVIESQTHGRYWSSTRTSADSSIDLIYSPTGARWDNYSDTKYFGFAVRCVKNY